MSTLQTQSRYFWHSFTSFWGAWRLQKSKYQESQATLCGMESNFYSTPSSLLMCPSSGSSMIKATSPKRVWLNKVPPHFTGFAWVSKLANSFIHLEIRWMPLIDVRLGERSTLIWLMVYFYFLNSLFSASLISPAPDCELDYNCKWSSYYLKWSFPLPGPSSAPGTAVETSLAVSTWHY